MEMLIRTVERPEIRQAEGEARKITFVASDSTRDSAHTVLNQRGWDLERFNNNGVIGYQHKVYGGWDDTENPDNVIGKGYAYLENDKLMVDVEFEPADINPLADKVYKKLQFGSLKAVSVGFVPVGKGKFGDGEEGAGRSNETYYYEGQQLLEVSVVNIPSNPNALRRSAEIAEAELAELRAAALAEETPEEKPEEAPEAPVNESQVEEPAVDVEAAKRAIEIATKVASAEALL